MPHKTDIFLNNKQKRILFSLSAFVLLFLVSYIIDPYSLYWEEILQYGSAAIFKEVLSSFIFCLLLSESCIRIGDWLNSRISWTVHPVKRLTVETVLTIVSVLAINFVYHVYCVYTYQDGTRMFSTALSIEETRGMLQWLVASVMITLMIMAINAGNYLIYNWKNESLKTAELKQMAAEAELQALKLQIDPHFVFNNLSVLSELILEDQQLGYQYAENFSKIYRYLLMSSKKDTTSLQEELKFLQSYIFLIKQRIGDAVHFEIDIDIKNNTARLPPLTLQLLVENALKHNKRNKKHPLLIKIGIINGNELKVENNRQPVEQPLESSGLGLKNIFRRYALLSGKQPKAIENETTFSVTLPLLSHD